MQAIETRYRGQSVGPLRQFIRYQNSQVRGTSKRRTIEEDSDACFSAICRFIETDRYVKYELNVFLPSTNEGLQSRRRAIVRYGEVKNTWDEGKDIALAVNGLTSQVSRWVRPSLVDKVIRKRGAIRER